ncbi:MAG: branched-chain amino acid ABC transporter permease, partial [Alphaproteobacteria bacterium]|nr:branched-chain amino acid ABC transporter permease [Alphaproteobacteria bacterium]
MTQILIQGLLLSGLYALIAIGFTLIFSVGRVLNLAYGAYLMIGAYGYFYVVQMLGM